MGIKSVIRRVFASPFMQGFGSALDLSGSSFDSFASRFRPVEMPDAIEDAWKADAEAMRGDWAAIGLPPERWY